MAFIDGQKGKLSLNVILQRMLLNWILNSIFKYLTTYLTTLFEFWICVLNWQCPKLNSWNCSFYLLYVNKWQFQSSHYSNQNPGIFFDSSLFLTCHIKSASSVDTSLKVYSELDHCLLLLLLPSCSNPLSQLDFYQSILTGWS